MLKQPSKWPGVFITLILLSPLSYSQNEWPHHSKDWSNPEFQARVLGVYDWVGTGPDLMESDPNNVSKKGANDDILAPTYSISGLSGSGQNIGEITARAVNSRAYFHMATDHRDIDTFPTRLTPPINRGYTSDPKDWLDRQDLIQYMQANTEIGPEFFQDKLTEDAGADTYYLMGNIYFLQGRYQDAISSYQRALARFHNFRLASQNLAYAHYLTGDCDSALTAASHASELGSMSVFTKGLVGYCGLQAGQYSTAAQALSMTRMLDSNNSTWQKLELEAHIETGLYPQAEAILNQRITDTSSAKNNIDSLLSVYRAKADSEQLLATLEIKQRLTGLEASEQTELDALKQEVGIGRVTAGNPLFALSLYENGNPRDALSLVSETLLNSPTDCDALMLSAKIHAQLNEPDLTDSLLFRARSSSDDCSSKARILQAQTALDRGEFQRAYTLYREDAQYREIAGEIQPHYQRQLLQHLARLYGSTVN